MADIPVLLRESRFAGEGRAYRGFENPVNACFGKVGFTWLGESKFGYTLSEGRVQ